MPKARVLFDSHGYHDGDQTRHANKGEVIDVSADELKRGLDLGSLEKADGKAAKEPTTEKAVVDMTVPELKAFAKKNELAVDPKLRKRDALVTAIDKALSAKAKGDAADDPKAAGATDPDEPTTPAGDPVGDGKTDQDA